MAITREPVFQPVSIGDLHPTQITVGMREVEEKRRRWRSARTNKKKAAEFLGKHLIPVVLGPRKRPYIIDHHHLTRALYEEGVKNVLVTVLENLSGLDDDAFWFVLDNRSWTHPYDDAGLRRGHEDIPRSVRGLVDDPFRSLAGALRRAGGFAKETMPFSEFLWTDFLRRRIARAAVEDDFAYAMENALKLARSAEANYLPGWCGPIPD